MLFQRCFLNYQQAEYFISISIGLNSPLGHDMSTILLETFQSTLMAEILLNRGFTNPITTDTHIFNWK